MKRYLLKFYPLLLLFLFPLVSMGKVEKDYTIMFEKEDFSFEEKEGIIHIISNRDESIIWGDSLSPLLPYYMINILISPDVEFAGVKSIGTESLIMKNVVVERNPPMIPTNGLLSLNNQKVIKYKQKSYPVNDVEYVGTNIMDGYKYLSFVVCPFRYDAANKNLYYKNDFIIKLSTENISQVPQKRKCSSGSNMRKIVKEMTINGNELDNLYANHISKQQSIISSTTIPFKYVIVTNDSLLPAFEKLANWKNIKGVHAKIITTSECYSTYPNDSHQLAIKKTLADYYYDGMEYALLGGDVDVVPARICYLPHHDKTDDTPVDLYYSCLDNDISWDANGNNIFGEVEDQVDLAPEFIITRASVSTLAEAEIFSNRIIEYESFPNQENWNKKMLMFGSKLSYYINKNNASISDAQWQGEYVYEHSIQPYWDGDVFKLFDTYTDHPSGTAYHVTADNIQTELEKGYSFVSEYSHGWVNRWGRLYNWDVYRHSDSEDLINPGYTIISTIACHTNAFDKVSTDFDDEQEVYSTSLSESFLRNPNSGVLAYYGSSREGWVAYSYYFENNFYRNIFSMSNRQFGRAAMLSKNSYIGSASVYNPYRWLVFSLNPIGDPEMPIFIDTPRSFNSVNVNYSNGDLHVLTGTDSCTVCVSSVDRNSSSFYHLSPNVSEVHMTGVTDDCYLCITKPGYVPYIARVGISVYLQNETILRNLPVFSTKTYVGRDVISTRSPGPVSLHKGIITNTSQQEIIINNDFEVKTGAELEIKSNE